MTDARRPNDTSSDRSRGLARLVEERLGARRFGMWFTDAARFDVDGERLVVTVPSRYAADWIERHFRADVEHVAASFAGRPIAVDVVAPDRGSSDAGGTGNRNDTPDGTFNGTANGHGSGTPDAPRDTLGITVGRDESSPAGRRQRHGARSAREAPRGGWRRLDDFIVGESNRLAFESARIMAETPERMSRLLFVHGECGVGKTHLLQGICERRLTRQPGAKVRYVTGEQFTNQFLSALRRNELDEFRARLRRLDLLAIDDVHFLANKPQTQQEILHTLDAIDHGGANVVLASDEHPRQIRSLSVSLVSRFVSGMIAPIQRPDDAMRRDLTRRLAAAAGATLQPAAVELLAARCDGSARELAGAIAKLRMMQELDRSGDEPIGVLLVERLADSGASSGAAMPVHLPGIIESTCSIVGVTRDELYGSGRHPRVVVARAIIATLGRELTNASYPDIARALGRRGHSAAHSSVQRLRDRIIEGEVLRDVPGTPQAVGDLLESVRRSLSRPAAEDR